METFLFRIGSRSSVRTEKSIETKLTSAISENINLTYFAYYDVTFIPSAVIKTINGKTIKVCR